MQVQTIELGNLELFSSLPQSFDVQLSERSVLHSSSTAAPRILVFIVQVLYRCDIGLCHHRPNESWTMMMQLAVDSPSTFTPCRLQGCKNRPALFHGWVS